MAMTMELLKTFAAGAAVAGGVAIAALLFSMLMSVTGIAGGAIKLAVLALTIYGLGRFIRRA